jgi:hypothetical protein
MKKLLIVVMLVIVFTVVTAHSQPYPYEVAPCGTKDFTTAADVVPGGTICLDIWLTGLPYISHPPGPQAQNAGSAWLDWSGSAADLAYVSGGRCMDDGSEGCTGPWTSGAGALVNEPAGVGTVMYVVANLGGAAPDADGDLIVGTVTLQNTGPNDATVDIVTLHMSSWTPINQEDVLPGRIVISQVCYCAIDAHCDDGLFCNGVETCDAPNCTCEPGTNPCPTDTTCNEDTDRCEPVLTAASIPTLSEWGMIIFIMLILGVGVVTLVRRRIV